LRVVPFLEALFLENLFCSTGVAIGCGCFGCFVDQFGMDFLSFLLAVCILDVFVDIMLLRMPGVIDIFL
jgi:hypothetical protein